MITVKSQMATRIKNNNITKEEVADYLVKNYNVYDLAMSVAESLFESAKPKNMPITLTEEQFLAHFHIIGQRLVSDGSNVEVSGDYVKETRGRKKGSKLVDGKVIQPESK